MKSIKDVFYRISPRNPLLDPISKSDLKMWSNGDTIVGALKYWQYSNNPVDDMTVLTQLSEKNAAIAAEQLFEIDFAYHARRGLCYDGVAACKCERSVYEMIELDGSCYTAHEDVNIDENEKFWVWKFEAEEISPLPEGDGYIVQPRKILGKECSREFANDMGQFDPYDLRNMLYSSLIGCCRDLDNRFGDIWIKRFSPQYKLFEQYVANTL